MSVGFSKVIPFTALNGVRTIANIIAPASRRIVLVALKVSYDGGSGQAGVQPTLIELCNSTQGTAGTSTPATPDVIRGAGQGIVALATLGTLYTVEPTVLTPIDAWRLTPAGGLIGEQLPLGREKYSDSASGTNKAFAIRITTFGAIGGSVTPEWEEE